MLANNKIAANIDHKDKTVKYTKLNQDKIGEKNSIRPT